MVAGEQKYTLTELLRLNAFKPFTATHLTGKPAHFLGKGPNGRAVGWWVGTTNILEWDTTDRVWMRPVLFG